MFSQIRKIVTLALILCAPGLLTACSSEEAQTNGNVTASKSDSKMAGGKDIDIKMTEAFAGEAELTSVNFSKWRQRRNAVAPEILVVDMWATWCVPCLERFPAMVAMSKKYVRQGVKFVSLNLDDRDDAGAIKQAKKFLSKQNAYFDHYMLDEKLLEGFEKLGIQTVPAVEIYGRDGKRAFRLTGDDPNNQFTDDDVEEKILELLKRG